MDWWPIGLRPWPNYDKKNKEKKLAYTMINRFTHGIEENKSYDEAKYFSFY